MKSTELIGKLLVLESCELAGNVEISGLTAHGVFKSDKEADRWVKNDAEDVFDPAQDKLEDLDNWGSDMLVVEVKRVVRAVPRVSVSVAVVRVSGEACDAR